MIAPVCDSVGPIALSDRTQCWRILVIRIDDGEMCRNVCVEQSNLLFADQFEQFLCFLIRHNELDLHGNTAGKLEERLLVQHVMAAETRDSAKG